MTVTFTPSVLTINPGKLEYHTLEPHLTWTVWCAQNLPKAVTEKIVYRLKTLLCRKGVFSGDWDDKKRPFMMREEFLLIADLNSVLSDFRSSLWYAQGRDAIARGQRFSHKDRVATTLPELDEIFSGYLVPLLETMQRDGYVQRPGTDLPEAMIGRDGTLIKTAHGTHRLASAKVCGVTQGFPVKVVGVHRIWLDSLPDKNPDQIKSALKQIEAAYQ